MNHGLLLIDKEPGCTSHDVVQRARRILRQKKIGHCGTLDPGATGLLVLTLGKATRLTRFLINAPKVYGGIIRFGIRTDTYDAEGEILEEKPIDGDVLTDEAVEAAMAEMLGEQEQAAPPFSAKKVKGVKYYELARRGEPVPVAKKKIHIYDFEALKPLADGRLEFTLSCSSGTYVRSVAHDLGLELGPGAHLEMLRRHRVGPFDVEDALKIGTLAGDPNPDPDSQAAHIPPSVESLGGAWVPLDSIPLPFLEMNADAQQERRVLNGQTILLRDSDCEEGDWVKLINQRRQLIAVGSIVERIGGRGVGVVRPKIVFR